MDDDNEYLKLPTEDQCVHKNWKARVHGYEAALKLFQQWDEKSPEWNKYTSLIKKFVVDSNAVAQEKGLEAVLAFVENSASASKTTQDVLNGIVTKCLGSPRARTKELGMQIAMMYVEIEKYEAVQEIFVGALTSQKNPKVVAACVATITRILNEFGLKVITVKPLLKAIPPILEDRDKNVRDEGKHLMVELYRWIGQALKPQLSNLKPIQVSELEAEFEKLGNEKPSQTRFLRSQQDLKAKFEAKAAGLEDEEEEEEEQAAPEIDPLELIEAVDILSKLPKDFYEKCEAKKWQERKEAMEELEKLVANPKLESGDYADLVRALKKIIAKDTNVNVIANAGKNLAGLANGLKKKFAPYAPSCVSVILDKFKEKKPNVVVAMREAIDAIYPSTNLEVIQEDTLAALDNKNPSIKAETASFLARSFTKCTPAILTKKLLKAYVTALLKTFNDSDATVREASAEALGTAMKVVGEKGILPFLGDLEPLKMAKLKECCEKAVLLVKVPGAKVVKPKEPPKPPEPVKSGPVIKKPSVGPAKPGGPSQPKQGAGAGPPKAAAKKAPAKSSGPEEKLEKELSQEEVDEKFAELFQAQVVSDLVDSNWKSRLAAMEQILQQIRFLEKTELPVQVVLRSITKKPGLKDTNFQVLKLKMEAVKVLAERGDFSKKSAEFCLSEVTEKLGDVKNSGTAAECLTAMAEAIGLDWISQEVMTFTLGQKNPKVHAEALNWTSEAIREFGFVVQPKAAIDFCKKSVQASNPAIRTAGITLAGTLYLYMGAPLRTFFEGEKPALLQTLDAEFEKHAGTKPPAPVRGLKPTQGQLGGSGNAEEETAAAPISVQDLVPRTDISGQFTGPIITELGDKNWKVRNEALQKVETIIKDAKFITPNLGELPPALAQRLTDSNKILVQTGLSICQQLAVAMGPHTKQHVRTLLPGILQSLSDNKANVRQTAITTMNIIAEQCGSLKEFFEAEMIADALKGGNPYLKADLLVWIAEKLGNANGINKDDLKACLPQLYACVEDRSADVRKGAQDAILPFMIAVGYEPMMRAAQNLKPASKNTVVALLEKARPNLPAKPQPPPAAASGFATTVRPKSAATTKMVHPVIDDDEAPPSRPTEKKPASNRAPSKSRLPSANAKGVPGRQKKEEEVDTSPLLQSNNLKNQRFNDELKLKALKWNFATPRDEFVDQLRDQMTTAGFSKSLMLNMFHADFKMHIKAIESLQDDLNGGNIEAQKANLDLLLKWMTIRFFDTNPSVLIKGLEYLSLVFGALSQDDYRMHDLEATSFVPYLITKIGDPKDAVKNSVHQIVRQMCKVVPTSKLFVHLMEGLKSKNARQRSECLDELGYFIETYGNIVYQGTPFLKEIAKQIADRDNSVRNAALNCIVQAYFVEGDKVRNMIGQLAEKDLAMLEERIKRAGKNRPVAAPAAPKQSSPETKLPQSRIGRPGSAPSQPPLNNNVQKAPETDLRREKTKSYHEEAQHLFEDIEDQIDKTLGIQTISINDVFSKLKKADLEGIDTHPVQLKRETSIPRPSPTRPTLEPITHRIAAIDVAIAQILDDNVQKCIQALLQVEQALQQDPMMITKVDSILKACTEQLQRNAEENSRTELETLKVYQTCLRTLHTLYGNDILGSKGSTESLQRLMPTLLDILVDPRFEVGVNESSNISKQTNLLIVRVVEKSDHTALTSTLLRLLLDSVESKGPGSKYVDLVQKCIWKVIRFLPEWIPTIKVEVLLEDIHDFMKAYPNASWKGRESDMPLRTVKTVLHTLVKHLGRDILNSLSGIEDLSKSELFLYLKKILAQGGLTSKEPRSSDGSVSIQSTSVERGKPVTHLTKEDQSQLTGIIRKIGTRELTRQGLEELYDFKLAHPDADLSPFFQKSSDFFRKYIERGLIVVEKERAVLGSKSVGTEPRSIPVVKSEPDQLNLYKERLKQIRINSGLDHDTENKQVVDNPVERLRAIKTKSSSMNEIASLRVSQTANISEDTVIHKTEESHSLTYQSSAPAVNGGSTQLTSRLEQLRSRLAFVKQSSQQ